MAASVFEPAAGGGSVTLAVSGEVASIQHSRNNKGGGGGSRAAVGDPAPEGDGDVSGGTNEGGELIGDDPDFKWPTANSGSWSNGANAYDQVDGTYATAGSNVDHQYNNFSHGVPGTDTIQGIEVKLEMSATSGGGPPVNVTIDLSYDGGTSWTSGKTLTTSSEITSTDKVFTLGGPSDTWGRTWSPSEFSDVLFRVRLTTPDSIFWSYYLDAIQVRVYHQASGGSSGGGGAI